MGEVTPSGFPKIHEPALRARLKAVVAGIKAGGESVRSVDISPEGAIRVLTGQPEPVRWNGSGSATSSGLVGL